MSNLMSQYFVPKVDRAKARTIQTVEAKEQERKEIAEQTAQFLANGGHIKTIEPGITGDKHQLKLQLTAAQRSAIQFKYR